MSETRKESFRKWATFIVSTLALLVACLRDPIVLTVKGTAHEVLREELARRESLAASDAGRERRRDSESETLRRLDQMLQAVREKPAANDSEQKLLLEVSSRLSIIESRLELLMREQPRDK